MAGHHKLIGKVATQAVEAIHDIAAALDSAACDYCLEGGTLLGVVREGRLLPWDDDVDLTVLSENQPRLLTAVKRLNKFKYRVRYRKNFINESPLVSGEIRLVRVTRRKLFFWKGDVRVDIFLKSVDRYSAYWTVGHPRSFVKKSVPKKYYQQLTSIAFEGQSVSIPQDYDEYLTLRYGDWKVPVMEWNCLTDDKATI